MDTYYYAVLQEGNVLFVTNDHDDACDFIDNHESLAIKETAEEYDWDIEDEGEYERAAMQNALDSGDYEIECISVEELKNNDEIELMDGSLITSNEILDCYKKSQQHTWYSESLTY